MYNLSAISHAVLQQLKQHHIVTPTRSQILELMAAYLGYKTYASFKADKVISKEKLNSALADQVAAFTRFDARLADLNIPISLANQLKQSVIQHFDINELAPKISLIRIAQHLGIAASQAKLRPSEVKASYEQIQTSHDSEISLLRYVWCCREQDQHSEDEHYSDGSSYWYEQRQAGVKLSATAEEWANTYERQLAADERQRALSNTETESSTELASPCFAEVIHGECTPNLCWQLDASYLLELFEDNMFAGITDEFLDDWERLAVLQNPTHQNLVRLAESLIDEVELWAWYLFGLSQQIDITTDNYSLINSDTGDAWDEYGPATPAGYDGIALPVISKSQRRKSQLLAERMQILISSVKK
ncbi:hypothetical protein [Rheinheimera tangshanensis]|uniref:Uncharacterized protein n=1 Tax=Rheinheimera tangshanensis TaxID=400153 RepID=A0A5C8M4L8_9GAMM|nr:hypothetical protein [Rheinheimera tangshanensis]TXK83303.1 hypothetical protein FU839_03250 [Rheinheimera tangshanensis]GGM44676.1 hypothetical protein GCM10010920_01170 [Rheinheimera tangshanensis]